MVIIKYSMTKIFSTLLLSIISLVLQSQVVDGNRYLKLGIKSHENGNYKVAILYYDTLLSINPYDVNAQYNKGISYIGLNKNKNAVTCFQEALKINPNHYNSLYEISKLYEIPEAIPLFCLLKMNIIEYKSDYSFDNFQKVQRLFHKFVENGDTSSVVVQRKPRFRKAIKQFYAYDHDNKNLNYSDNNFDIADLSIVVSGSFDYRVEYKKLNEAELLYTKLIPICKIMKEFRQFNHGIYWEVLGDYFINLYDTGNLKTACYLICSCLNKDEINSWLKINNDEVSKFLELKL